MNFIWRNEFGKLLVGGCGSQIGLMLSCTMLTIVLSLGAVCVFSNVLNTGLTYELSRLSPNVTPPAEDGPESTSLLTTVLQEIEKLQTTSPLAAVGCAEPPCLPDKPMVTAAMSGANLRSGPGLKYNRIGLLPKGDSLEVVGRNSDSSWWLVSAPNGFAWVFSGVVAPHRIDDSIPVVTIPALLTQPGDRGSTITAANTNIAIPTPTANPVASIILPAGTPTVVAGFQPRIQAKDTPGYKRLRDHTGQAVSESFAPHGGEIAVIDGIKLFTVAGDASFVRAWIDSDETLQVVGGAVWSPNGRYIAFVVDSKSKGTCAPCRSVGILNVVDKKVLYLEATGGLDTDAPRWTQDGRLLVNVHPSNPSSGTTYIYDTAGRGKVASGAYLLSSSHEGQKWWPWIPGRIWIVGNAGRPDEYYN